MERPYLTIEELVELFGFASKNSLLNAIHLEKFSCPTYKMGKRRVADKKVVEAYFDAKRAEGLAQITT